MIVTAYLVINSTSVITPQDIHVNDLQLEQLGHDALVMMDTPDSVGSDSMLKTQIENNNVEYFNTSYSRLINSMATTSEPDKIKFNAVYYSGEEPKLMKNFNNDTYYREDAVKVNRLVLIEDPVPRIVRFEVLLWRG